MSETKTCRQCNQSFIIEQEDLKFYDRISPTFIGKKYQIPSPKLCRDCRTQRRMSFRNERNLYNRVCDLCQKNIVSVYSPDKPNVVYCQECWWSDKWDAKDYGMEFDFNKSLSEQVSELIKKVPLPSSIVVNSVNCDYTNQCVDSKNCYLCFRCGKTEDSMYSHLPLKCIGCVDCYATTECQYCYECVDCQNCYSSFFCRLSKNLSDCILCFNCIGCKNCFGCVGLRNVEYHFFNKKLSKYSYQQKVSEYWDGTYGSLEKAKERFNKLVIETPQQAVQILHSQNAYGDYITDSKDIKNCFDVEKTEKAKYSTGVEFARDVFDSDYIYYGELCYENMSNSNSTNILFSLYSFDVTNMLYTFYCFNNSHDCFGCVGVKKCQYSVLNKKYSKEEYEKLVSKIIEHMKKTGEWGEFYQMKISPFGYNETIAHEYFALKENQVLKLGARWQDNDFSFKYKGEFYEPLNIKDYSNNQDEINKLLSGIIKCVVSNRPFKITPTELAFYIEHGIPIPTKHYNVRHKERLVLRNPRKLYNRVCMCEESGHNHPSFANLSIEASAQVEATEGKSGRCPNEFETTYASDRPEKVYCESCYHKSII
ncbi:hypothetical protein A3F08_01360 [Candidatus Berkelbacteria bacterium RIFCSPHIGHO2_12_FULL_36_9]|uniref:Zinc-binding domain-containing protein n=1 Tax=Candidatus Berkelbacteria bacterium RIFCSPHIGHO2_12_FULL_36_9 TaxID=1797469 RepID=A0A1F5EKQ6_9BACT|nr:MAG: hypothetical protein A3F08_01360 [Candidatus Berkelbacteria bacterium RIFCSPHIGHO2_12_FULL_36_9]